MWGDYIHFQSSLLDVFLSFGSTFSRFCCCRRFLHFLFFTFILLHRVALNPLLGLRLHGDLPQLDFAFEGGRERQGRLEEVQGEDAHVAVEAVFGDLQGPASGTRHQLLLLQNQDVVRLLAGLVSEWWGGGGLSEG